MKRHAPAAERNRRAILDAVGPRLGPSGRLLGGASGTGQHAAAFAVHLPGWTILPTEIDPAGLASIEAHRAESTAGNLEAARSLDVTARPWPVDGPIDAVFNANMVHISGPETLPALLGGAAEVLRPSGVLFVYGPFLVDGRPTTDSNRDFDQSLRSRDPRWGLRDLAEVDRIATACGLRRTETLRMPANNFLLVLHREAAP